MKIRILILLTLFSFQGFSQELEKVNGVAPYFKAGVNTANFINWDDNEPTDRLTSLHGGMGLYIRLGKPRRKTLSMALEGNFEGHGFSMKHNDQTYKVRTSYFGASALLRHYFGNFFVTAGAERAWLMSAREIIESETEDVPEGIYHKGVWNGIGGIGMNFGGKYSRQVDLGFELTYKHGLSEIRNDFVKARHSVFSLSMFIPMAFIGEMAAAMQY